jgi:two-component system sensor histidine kinase CpxA
MGRLFWKIFFWFWAAMILVGIGVAWGTAQLLKNGEQSQFPGVLARVAGPQVTAIATVLEQVGEASARDALAALPPGAPFRVLVIDEMGKDLLGRPVPQVLPGVGRERSPPARQAGRALTEREVRTPGGATYRIVPVSKHPRGAFRSALRPLRFGLGPRIWRDPVFVGVRIGLALVIGALVCAWLAWYLTRPVKQLRAASLKLAAGDLGTRVTPRIGRRRDEIADLGRDFDRMAERLQGLVSAQRQLLSDVSHELRSPLARLQVALGLARKRAGAGAAPELERIDREAERLEELVGQVLSLSRLDAGAPVALNDYVDLPALLETVAEDANFEAGSAAGPVTVMSTDPVMLQVNAELIHRALENIVRNAVRYTRSGTQVEVAQRVAGRQVEIDICDRGPGVRPDKIGRLFDPFVRIDTARDRGSGGYGLGLAIARRAIERHGGTVGAENRVGGGLCVRIRLPRTDDDAG